MNAQARRFSGTRALKNLHWLRVHAPEVFRGKEPQDGWQSVIPIDVLSRLHRSVPDRLEAPLDLGRLQQVAFPKAQAHLSEPVFSGTVHFAQIIFTVTTFAGTISVPTADVQTAVAYATKAAPQINAYTYQYGPTRLTISQTILPPYNVTLPGLSYSDKDVQGWVNAIKEENNIPAGDCIVVLNPENGVFNLDASVYANVGGYHCKASLPYVFVNLLGGGLTVADPNDFYAAALSHELAEMAVDPAADHNNPEVCDPCEGNPDLNIGPYLAFFDPFGALIGFTRGTMPTYPYDFFISCVAKPGSPSENAPTSACAYAQPHSGEVFLYYDRGAGTGAFYAVDGAGDMQVFRQYEEWRTSWDLVVAGSWAPGGLLLYERASGTGAIYRVDENGETHQLSQSTGWLKSWDLAVAGNWTAGGLFLYDRGAGFGAFYRVDSHGVMHPLSDSYGWRKSWDLAVPGNWAPGGLLLYDRAAGFGAFYSVDSHGKLGDPLSQSSQWRKSWDLAVSGNWAPGGLFLYDRAAGFGAFYSVDSHGKLGDPLSQYEKLGNSWDLAVSGNWARGGLLLYDRAAGIGAFYTVDSHGVMTLRHQYDDWRKTWASIIAWPG